MNKQEINLIIARFHDALDKLKVSADEIATIDEMRAKYIKQYWSMLSVLYRHIDWLNKDEEINDKTTTD